MNLIAFPIAVRTLYKITIITITLNNNNNNNNNNYNDERKLIPIITIIALKVRILKTITITMKKITSK